MNASPVDAIATDDATTSMSQVVSDRLPGTSYDNPIRYRGYRIYLGPGYTRDTRWQFTHEDWDGAPTHSGEGPADNRYGMAGSLDECKADIDDIEESTRSAGTTQQAPAVNK